MSSGIYIIKNTQNNKVYVGSSVNVKNREYKHFWMLGRGVHDNPHLQKSYNKYGKSSFIFEVVEICDESKLIDKENYYISNYKSNVISFGYNLATVNEFRRNTFNDEVKVKLSKYNLIKNKNFFKFSLTNIDTMEIFIFESLVDGANYLIKNGFTKGSPRNIRMKISSCLRGVKLNNGYQGSIRKTCYKHIFKIIN
jgi:group I intron endonuclease